MAKGLIVKSEWLNEIMENTINNELLQALAFLEVPQRIVLPCCLCSLSCLFAFSCEVVYVFPQLNSVVF